MRGHREDLPIVAPRAGDEQRSRGRTPSITGAAGAFGPRPLRVASREILAPWRAALADSGGAETPSSTCSGTSGCSPPATSVSSLGSPRSSTRSRPQREGHRPPGRSGTGVLRDRGGQGEGDHARQGDRDARARLVLRRDGIARSGASVGDRHRRDRYASPGARLPRVLRPDQRGAQGRCPDHAGLAERLRAAEPRQPQH